MRFPLLGCLRRAALGISPSTMKRHLEAIYRKLGVRSRAAATALAIDTIAHA